MADTWKLTAEELSVIRFVVVDGRYAVEDRDAAMADISSAIEEALATHRPQEKETSRG